MIRNILCAVIVMVVAICARGDWGDTDTVSCGHHTAPSCRECPQDHGSRWCNGECKWSNGVCVHKGIVGVDVIRTKTRENATFEWRFTFPEDQYVFIEIQKVTTANVIIYGIAFKQRGGKFTIYNTMKGRVEFGVPAADFGVRMRILNVTMMDSGSYRCMVRLQRASYVLQHVIKLVVRESGPCVSQPCQNNGTCHSPTPTTYNCLCLKGFAGNDCTIGYEPLGCFDDKKKNRALPIKINSFRETIDWKNIDKTIKKCSSYAMELGYTVFGIQFYGECWSGPNADTTYDKHGPSINCWKGVGTTLTNFVYVNHNLSPTPKAYEEGK